MHALLLIPIVSAALAPWQDTVSTSSLRGLDDFSAVTYSPGGGLASSALPLPLTMSPTTTTANATRRHLRNIDSPS